MKLALSALIGAAGVLAACADEYPPPPPPPAPVAAAVVPGAPAVAVAPAPTGSGCFRTGDIVNHQIADDHTLFVRTRDNRVWRMEMAGACLSGAGSGDPLVIHEPPGVPYVCRAVDLDISIRKGGFAMGGPSTPCIPQSLTQLSPAEVAALPSKLRP